MKKNWQSILTVIMAILLIVCLIQINSLTDRVNQLNTNFTSQINIVRDSINNISRSVNDSLEQQASILSDAVWEYGKIDLEKRTAEVEVTITPKEYDTNTHAYVSVGTQSFPLTLNNGSFVGTLELPLFQETYLDKVRFVEGNDTRTEKLDWYFAPMDEALPSIYADLSFNYSQTTVKDGKCQVNLNGDLNVNIDGANGVQIENIVLAVSDGKNDIMRKDITNEVSSDRDGSMTPEAALSMASGESRYFYYSVNENLTLESNNKYTVYCELIDANGLCYRSELLELNVDDKSASLGDVTDCGSRASVYDSKGNLLYKEQ